MSKELREFLNDYPELFPDRVTITVSGENKQTIGFDLKKETKLSDALREVANTLDDRDSGLLKRTTDIDSHLRTRHIDKTK